MASTLAVTFQPLTRKWEVWYPCPAMQDGSLERPSFFRIKAEAIRFAKQTCQGGVVYAYDPTGYRPGPPIFGNPVGELV